MTTQQRGGSLSSNEHDKLQAALDALLAAIPAAGTPDKLSSQRIARLRAKVEQAITALEQYLPLLDKVRQPDFVFDPSDPAVVGQLIAKTLLVQERRALGAVPKFYGSGVYAIYYAGSHPAYQPIAGQDWPIYVGKADPAEHGATTPKQQGMRLWVRLKDHADSISDAQNLELGHFDCRYLVVKSAWQNTAEAYLIRNFMPVWNKESKVCYGFGKHGDSAKTRANARSPWDTLHPGREWATEEGNKEFRLSITKIMAAIAQHFKAHGPP